MVRNILLITAIILTTSLFASSPKAIDLAQISQGHIHGKVQSFDLDRALPQAQVVVYSETFNIVKVTTTNIKGEYSISDLPEGKYFLTINYLGYKPVIIDNINIKSAREEITLKDVSMEIAYYNIKEVVVTAKRKNNNIAILSSIEK